MQGFCSSVLAWHISRDIVVPKSANEERQKDTLDLQTPEPEDVKRITALNREERIFNKPNEDGMVYG